MEKRSGEGKKREENTSKICGDGRVAGYGSYLMGGTASIFVLRNNSRQGASSHYNHWDSVTKEF